MMSINLGLMVANYSGPLSHALHEFRDRDSKRVRNSRDVAERNVPLPPLDPADVRAIQLAFVGERLLGQADSNSPFSNPLAEPQEDIHLLVHWRRLSGTWTISLRTMSH